jgi:hypothetical protein
MRHSPFGWCYVQVHSHNSSFCSKNQSCNFTQSTMCLNNLIPILNRRQK